MLLQILIAEDPGVQHHLLLFPRVNMKLVACFLSWNLPEAMIPTQEGVPNEINRKISICGITAQSVKNNCLSRTIWIQAVQQPIVYSNVLLCCFSVNSYCSCWSHSVLFTHSVRPCGLVFPGWNIFLFCTGSKKSLNWNSLHCVRGQNINKRSL